MVGGTAAVAPEVTCGSPDMYFAGWDAAFSCVAEDMVVHALYYSVDAWADGRYTQKVGDYTWSFTIANGEATIGVVDERGNSQWQRAVEPELIGAVEIPSELGGCPVTGIGYSAFMNCTRMTSAELPSTVREIGGYAFAYCYGLAGAGLSDSLESIGYASFCYCRSLASVSIPSGVTNIDSEAFVNCHQLETVVFAGDKDRIEIGARAFLGTPYNENLPFQMIVRNGALVGIEGTPPAEVEILSGVTQIGDYAFQNCATLKKVTIPEGVTFIGYDAFYGCENLAEVRFKGNAPSACDSSIYSNSPSVTNYVREGSVGWMESGSAELPDLWPVNGGANARPIRLWPGEPAITHTVRFDLGEHIVRTGGGALEQTVVGGTAAIAPEVEAGGGYEFVGWDREFSCVTADMAVHALYRREGALGDGHYTEEVGGYTWSFTIADGGATIEYGDRQWQRAVEPNPSGAVEIPSELGGWPVTGIGYCAFYYCRQMTSVKIPASVRTIGSHSFYETGLHSIVIPVNVQKLESYVFSGDLTSVCFEGNAPESVDLWVYGSARNSLTAFVRPGSTGWSVPGSEVLPASWPLPDRWGYGSARPLLTWMTHPNPGFRVDFDLGEGAERAGGGELAQVVTEGMGAEAPALALNPGYEFVGWDADFDNVSGSMDVHAWYRKDGKLTGGENHTQETNGYAWTFSVVDGKAIIGTTDGYGERQWQRAVEPAPVGAVEIPSELGGCPVAEIGYCAFVDCNRMTSVKIPAGVTNLADYAFEYCNALKSATIPASVTSIGCAFCQDKALQALAFEGSEPDYRGDSRSLASTTTVVLVREDAAGWREDGQLLATWPRTAGNPCQVRLWNGTMGEYDIVYELGRNGENAKDNPDFYIDALLPLKLSEPTREGYAFKGWLLDGREASEIPAGTVGPITLTAKWDETPAASGWGWSDGVRQWRYVKVQYNDSGTTKTGAKISNNRLCAVSPLPQGALTVPSEVDGYPVVELDRFAFADCTGLTSVVLPSCFVGNDLTAAAFAGCENLTSVSVDKGGFTGLYNVQDGLLLYRDDWLVLCPPGLANPIVPETVQTLEKAAFYENRKMRRIVIPDGIDEIPAECFVGCENLSEIVCPEAVTSFDGNPFKGTAWEAAQGDFTVMNGVLLDYRGKEAGLSIPSTVRHVNSGVFQYRGDVVSVDLPPCVERIGDYAFYYCSGLARLTGGDGLVQVGQYALRGTALWNAAPDGLIAACGWVVDYKGMAPDELVVPADVRGIADSAFSGCENLKEVTYMGDPSGVLVGRGAFYETPYEAAMYPFFDSPTEANAEALANGKLLFVLSGADWCPWTTVVKKYLRWLGDDFFSRFVVYYCNVDTDTHGMAWGVPSYGVFDPAKFSVNWYDGCLASNSGGVEERVQKVIDDGLAAYGQGMAELLTWYTTKAEAFAAAKASGKRILLVFGRDTCGNTTATRNSTCEDATVKAKLLEGYVLWYSNCDTQSSESGKYLKDFDGNLPGVTVIDPYLDKGIVGTSGYLDAAGMLGLFDLVADYDSPVRRDGEYEEMVGGCTWSFVVNGGEVSIGRGTSAAIPDTTAGELVVPLKLGGCPVVRIGECAFLNCSGLTAVTIPSRVTSIGTGAFDGCSSLKSIFVYRSGDIDAVRKMLLESGLDTDRVTVGYAEVIGMAGTATSVDLVADLGLVIPDDVDYAKGDKVTVKVEGLAKGLKLAQDKETHSWVLSGVPTEPIDFEKNPMYARVTVTYKDKMKGEKGKAELLQPLALSIAAPEPFNLSTGVLNQVYGPVDIAALWPGVADAKDHPKEWSFKGWPSGLKYKDGEVSGSPKKAGEFPVTATWKHKLEDGKTTVSETFPAVLTVWGDDGKKDFRYTSEAYKSEVGKTIADAKSVSGLPTGLKFDKATGRVTGTPTKPGVYRK